MKKIYVFLFILLVGTPFFVHAQIQVDPSQTSERIVHFDSDITINSDASLLVHETIVVNAKGDQIKRGIYRDFPTTYTSKNHTVKVNFEILGVTRDSQPEPYHVEDINNGKRIYLGDENTYLQPAVYTYVITYQTNKQIGFFKDHDELYWNVTGNGWDFEINSATARVHLPPGILEKNIQTEAYTGGQNSVDKNYISSVESNGVYFSTTKKLSINQGFTIVVGFPKGFITEPSQGSKIISFLLDNLLLIGGTLFTILIFLYYFIEWKRYGKDPEHRAVVVQYEPPANLSPSAVRYISNMSFDNKILTTAIINLATKGYIKIKEIKNNKHYALEKIKSDYIHLLEDEKILMENMYPKSVTEFHIKPSKYRHVQSLELKLSLNFEVNFKDKLFILNTIKFVGGLLISLITLFIGSSLLNNDEGGFVIVSAIVISVSLMFFNYSIRIKNKAITSCLIIIEIITSIVLFFGILLIANKFNNILFIQYCVFVYSVSMINFIFYFLLKKRTIEGQKVQNEIEGFKIFLSMTEKDRMNFFNPPDKTPELFEKFLPYAIALDIENKWTKQFHSVFVNLQANGEEVYHPLWFDGSGFSTSNIAESVSSFSNSFSTSVVASSTAPGSSSGFSGGGSSGGGGGGGGW